LAHNLGNLSLTFDNTTLGNKSFIEKRGLLVERSRLRLNQMLLDYDVFGPAQIQNRAHRLLQLFADAYELPDAPWHSTPVRLTQHPYDLTAQQWLDRVRADFSPPEFIGLPIARFWSDICGHVHIEFGGDSPRRALDRWRLHHNPAWPRCQ
jgi:hypothetical protein